MFNSLTNVRSPYQAVAILVAAALVLWSAGAYATTAQAANLVELQNLISDSAPSAEGVTHTFSFEIPSDTVGNTTEVDITFPAGFDVSSAAVGGGSISSANLAATNGQVLTIDGFTAAPSASVTIEIENVDSPAATGSYEFELNTNAGDVGFTRIVIIDTVLVTASVDTTFEFTITGTGTTPVSINGQNTTGTTSSTEIPFGTLAAGTEYLLAQQLNVQTNAGNGFVVTVESDSDGDLVSATGADINQFVDATAATTPTAWVSPDNDVLDPDTWGHWGWASTDQSLDQSTFGNVFGNDEFAAVTGSPQPVFWHDGPSDGVTDDIGQVLVGYKIEITALQEAAEDYQTTLTYIATPTF